MKSHILVMIQVFFEAIVFLWLTLAGVLVGFGLPLLCIFKFLTGRDLIKLLREEMRDSLDQ